MTYKILFLGSNWYGGCARACCYALRRLGHDVLDIDEQTVVPLLRRVSSRVLIRLLRGRLVREYNSLILESASRFEPDLLISFKGTYVHRRTLRDSGD